MQQAQQCTLVVSAPRCVDTAERRVFSGKIDCTNGRCARWPSAATLSMAKLEFRYRAAACKQAPCLERGDEASPRTLRAWSMRAPLSSAQGARGSRGRSCPVPSRVSDLALRPGRAAFCGFATLCAAVQGTTTYSHLSCTWLSAPTLLPCLPPASSQGSKAEPL